MTHRASQRTLLKAAQRIHDRLTCQDDGEIPGLFHDGWRELLQLACRLEYVHQRGWAVARRMLRDDARASVRRLERQLHDWLDQLPRDRNGKPTATVREIHDDLLALQAEFSDFGIDLKEETLSAVTDPIALKDVELGRFEIVLRWGDLSDTSPYEVVALDGNPAGHDSSITHPHVRDDRLCEGQGQSAIRSALRSGRLFDFFVLVRQILETYNSTSAYVPLEQWNGRECRDCGERVSDDESTCCERCDRDLCFGCSATCGQCQRDCCVDCRVSCQNCDSSVCDRCAEGCRSCNERFCPHCLRNGTCEACLETENDSHEMVPETTAPADEDRLPAAAALHSHGVGQAPLPA